MYSRLFICLDWFLPASLRAEKGSHRRARMFVITHLFGAPLGFLVALSIFWLDPAPGMPLGIIAGTVGAFWAYPFVLRWTGRFDLLALLSVQQLSCLVLFTAFHYGGASSPFLCWLLAAPVSAYFYFGPQARLRTLVLVLLAADLLTFYLVYAAGYPFPERVPLAKLSGIGILSVFCAAAFVSMLSLNYTNIVAAQQLDLEHEVASRRSTENALRQAMAKAEELGASFRLLFDGNPMPMWVYDRETLRFLEVNDAALAQYGYSREQFLAMTVDRIRPPEDRMRVRALIKEMIAPYQRPGVWRHRRADGSEILVDVLWHSLDFQGRPAAIAAAIDVTDQKRAEEALRESEARLREILDTANDAFISIDAHGIVNAWNTEAERIFGWPADEVIGDSLADTIIPERFRAAHRAGLKRFLASNESKMAGQRIELCALRRDGSEFEVEMTISRMRGKHGPLFNSFIHDITERKEREQAIRDSEARYRLLAENITDMITVLALDGTRTYVSPSVRDFLGYEPAELIGKRMIEMPHPDDAPVAAGAVAALTRGDKQVTITVRSRHKNGAYIWVETSLRLVRDPASNKPIEVLCVSRDVSARQALQEQLALAKELAERANRAKSEFLANMSHELRTPLNAIMGFGDLIENQRLGALGNAKYAGYGRDIVESGKHLLDLINEILDYAKLDAGRLSLIEEPLDIHRVVEACEQMLSDRIERGGLVLETSIAPTLSIVRGDERRLRQVLLNLLSNSIKFTKPGGRITLDAHADAGGALVLTVSDTGIGIAEQDLPHVLEPFGQVDSAFNRSTEGTGLGLPLAKRLVEMHGGTLVIDSAPGIGTTAIMRLPAERVLKNVA